MANRHDEDQQQRQQHQDEGREWNPRQQGQPDEEEE